MQEFVETSNGQNQEVQTISRGANGIKMCNTKYCENSAAMHTSFSPPEPCSATPATTTLPYPAFYWLQSKWNCCGCDLKQGKTTSGTANQSREQQERIGQALGKEKRSWPSNWQLQDGWPCTTQHATSECASCTRKATAKRHFLLQTSSSGSATHHHVDMGPHWERPCCSVWQLHTNTLAEAYTLSPQAHCLRWPCTLSVGMCAPPHACAGQV